MEPIKDIKGNIIEPGDILITPIGGCHLAETKLIRYTNKGCYISRGVPRHIPGSTIADFSEYRDANLQTKLLYLHNTAIKKDSFLIIKKHNC